MSVQIATPCLPNTSICEGDYGCGPDTHMAAIARIMPVFHGAPWDAETAYGALEVVEEADGTMYITKCPTPAGTPLDNCTYWAVYNENWNVRLEKVENRLDDVEDDVDALEAGLMITLQPGDEGVESGTWLIDGQLTLTELQSWNGVVYVKPTAADDDQQVRYTAFLREDVTSEDTAYLSYLREVGSTLNIWHLTLNADGSYVQFYNKLADTSYVDESMDALRKEIPHQLLIETIDDSEVVTMELDGVELSGNAGLEALKPLIGCLHVEIESLRYAGYGAYVEEDTTGETPAFLVSYVSVPGEEFATYALVVYYESDIDAYVGFSLPAATAVNMMAPAFHMGVPPSNKYPATSIAVGSGAECKKPKTTGLGVSSNAKHENSVALGYASETSREHEVSIGSNKTTRYLAGVKNPTYDTDAANKGYVDEHTPKWRRITSTDIAKLAYYGGPALLAIDLDDEGYGFVTISTLKVSSEVGEAGGLYLYTTFLADDPSGSGYKLTATLYAEVIDYSSGLAATISINDGASTSLATGKIYIFADDTPLEV